MAQTSSFTLSSKSFADNQPIPARFTGDGEDLSPALYWEGAPAGVKQFALIVDDPDAPTPTPWVHWVIYGIPASVSELNEGVTRSPELKDIGGIKQGKNSWNTVGYRGPAPPRGHGVHRYVFHLYALKNELNLKPALAKESLLREISGSVIGETKLIGTYKRP